MLALCRCFQEAFLFGAHYSNRPSRLSYRLRGGVVIVFGIMVWVPLEVETVSGSWAQDYWPLIHADARG